MNKEEIENNIAELEEHSRNILKVGNYIKQLQQENQELKKQLDLVLENEKKEEENEKKNKD